MTALLPAIRSLVAKELTEHLSFTQTEAGQRLGTTQAAISQYLNRKRGGGLGSALYAVPEIKQAILDLAGDIAEDDLSPVQVMTRICDLCILLRRDSLACTLHRESMELPYDCQICRI